MVKIQRLLLALALATGAAPALALEHRSVTEATILFDAPSEQGRKLFVILPQTPVELVVTLDKWAKVRDITGGLAWIERRYLSDHRRTVQVRVPRAAVRQRPEDSAPPSFEVLKDVVLELSDAPVGGWIKVKHRDGVSGYIPVTDVWGL